MHLHPNFLLSTQTTKHTTVLYFQILNITNVPVQSEWLDLTSYCSFLCLDPAVFCGLWRWAGTMEEELCYSTVIFKPSDNGKPTGMFRLFFLHLTIMLAQHFPCLLGILWVVFLFLDDQNINELINALLNYSRVRGDCIIRRSEKTRLNITYNLRDFRLEITHTQNMYI